MIIKKKYAQIKKIEEAEVKEEKAVEPKIEAEPKQAEQEEVIVPKTDDFDLTLSEIKFEPREERREGTRRRGYRRTQDRNLITRAQEEAAAIKEAAKQDGYKDGIKKAEEDIALLREKLNEFYKYKDEVFEKVSACILEISVEIAKKIIKKETQENSDVTLSIIKGAVEEINKTENKIILKVMPKDVEIIRDKVPEIFSDGTIEAQITVVPDNNIKEGGVIIETSNGIIDATIETQLGIIEKALISQEEEEA